MASLTGLGLSAPFISGKRDWSQEPITLRYTSHTPRSHGLYTEGFVPFAELVEKETGGRLRLEPFTDKILHGPIDGFKAAVTGITDYTHSYITYQPGSFRLLHAPQLPFMFSSPQVASLVGKSYTLNISKKSLKRWAYILPTAIAQAPTT